MPSITDLRGWSRLTAAVADEVVVGTVYDMQRAISDGTYRWIGPVGRPVQRITDAVTDNVYGLVRVSIRGVGELGAMAAGRLGSDTIASSPAAEKARAIAHGVVGDDRIAVAPELDIHLGLRHNGVEVATDPASLRAAYPAASGRVVVFVHGLVDTEAVWSARPEAGVALPDLVDRLDATPVLVRYGTGRSIGRNGADLADHLEALVGGWPVPVTDLILVGHSMGGLLIRAACITAVVEEQAWTQKLHDIVYLGTPHFGSWLEKAANTGSWVLRHASTRSAPIGTLLDGRSRGIKDLRFGMLTEDGWDDAPIDDLLTGRFPDEPWLPGVTHHLVVGRLRAWDHHPLNHLFGDSLVRKGSASGAGRRRQIAGQGEVRVAHVPHPHTHLTNAPPVAELLGDILAAEPAAG